MDPPISLRRRRVDSEPQRPQWRDWRRSMATQREGLGYWAGKYAYDDAAGGTTGAGHGEGGEVVDTEGVDEESV